MITFYPMAQIVMKVHNSTITISIKPQGGEQIINIQSQNQVFGFQYYFQVKINGRQKVLSDVIKSPKEYEVMEV